MPERSFGRTVRYRRSRLGLSQAKLGELVGRSPSTVRSWERDKTQPNDSGVLTALSAILGVDERSLFEKAGQTPPEVEDSPTVEEALATLNPEANEEPVESETDPDLLALPEVPDAEPQMVGASEPAYVAPPDPYVITPPTPPVVAASYMEDTSQRQLYRVRNLATVVALVALGIALLWALGEGLDAFGSWWDDFFGNLRL